VADIFNQARSALRQAVELWNGGASITHGHTDCSVVLGPGGNLPYCVIQHLLEQSCEVSGGLLVPGVPTTAEVFTRLEEFILRVCLVLHFPQKILGFGPPFCKMELNTM
jgi:hypothetical protein